MQQVAARPLDGEIRYGTFQGACATTALDGAAAALGIGPVRRRLREKRWQYFAAADGAVAVGGAIVHLGWAGHAFLWAVERGRPLVEAEVTALPFSVRVGDEPGEGLVARCRGLTLRRAGGALHAAGRLGQVEVEVRLEEAGTPFLTAVAPVKGGGVNLTAKQAGLRAAGEVRIGGRRIELGAGAVGLADYTHGLLARVTSWRWAAGGGRLPDGTRVGFNLVDGFNDALENGIWIGGALQPAGRARFAWDAADPAAPWAVRTEDGSVDLRLEPEAVRRRDLRLGLATSWYRQPVGRWSGRLGGLEVEGLFGVAEDHRARW